MLVSMSKNNSGKHTSKKIIELVILNKHACSEHSKLSRFYKLAKSFNPVIEASEKLNWEKLIHNYKYDIYHGTYEEYKDVWNYNDQGFGMIYVEVKNDIMYVSFDEKFIRCLEELFPEKM